jgi:DNA-3-methyladenine glycosylase II
VSRQKAGYLKDLAGHFKEKAHTFKSLGRLTDEKIIIKLTAIKGVGVWTAKMILIFTLGRPDVLPHEDLGIQLAVREVYGLRTLPDARKLSKLAEPWRPYRSLAAWYLWASRDRKKH